MTESNRDIFKMLKEQCEEIASIEERAGEKYKQRTRMRLNELLECNCITLDEYTKLNFILG